MKKKNKAWRSGVETNLKGKNKMKMNKMKKKNETWRQSGWCLEGLGQEM